MLLDDIISSLNQEPPADAQNQSENERVDERRGNSRLSYSDEFWGRFGKSTTAREEK